MFYLHHNFSLFLTYNNRLKECYSIFLVAFNVHSKCFVSKKQ